MAELKENRETISGTETFYTPDLVGEIQSVVLGSATGSIWIFTSGAGFRILSTPTLGTEYFPRTLGHSPSGTELSSGSVTWEKMNVFGKLELTGSNVADTIDVLIRYY